MPPMEKRFAGAEGFHTKAQRHKEKASFIYASRGKHLVAFNTIFSVLGVPRVGSYGPTVRKNRSGDPGVRRLVYLKTSPNRAVFVKTLDQITRLVELCKRNWPTGSGSNT